jgi:nicotinate-nucleotide--dimethylbenzimidazole phosphoribosyltransferase
MRRLKLIGIGAGNPDYITVQAIKALEQVDVVFLNDKGPRTVDLVDARKALCERYLHGKPYRTIEISDPERDRDPVCYENTVARWHAERALLYEKIIDGQLADGECGAFLIWGDPSLYDSTLRIIDDIIKRGALSLDLEIIPGITSIQALAARHKIPLNDIGEPVHVTTGRRLKDAQPAAGTTTVVLLDGQCAFKALASEGTYIYWGAYLGTPDEMLLAGPLNELGEHIEQVRTRARAQKGWIMDTYILKHRESAPDSLPQRLQSTGPIPPVNELIRTQALRRLDILTKPLGALGQLETLAAQLCAIQGTLNIEIVRPVGLVFAADHGVADRGVSAYPREVTAQMVTNFLQGGAAISVLAKLHGVDLWIVDAGVDGECMSHPRLMHAKIRRGTRDFIEQAAMTSAECAKALDLGQESLERARTPGSNAVILGEMGIGNTAAAALLMHGLTQKALIDCVGRGTGLDDGGLARKRDLLTEAVKRRAPPKDPLELLAEFGGYEIAMLVGAVLAAAARQMLILVDGFTVSVAVAIAARVDAGVLGYCVFAHRSAEQAHDALLEHLRVRPLLDLRMRLGEGSGAALALPLVRAAVALFTQMATFEGAGVSDKGI